MKNDRGQVILILILIMTVALAIGISVVQRSISDVSTASKVEQSSRAFSAAEAGIENTLATGNTSLSLSNNAQAQTVNTGWSYPSAPGPSSQQKALEFISLSKEETAQVWLADRNSALNPPAGYYTQSSLDVYWGNSSTDRAALELTLVYYDGTKYTTRKWYLDQRLSPNIATNKFTPVDCTGSYPVVTDLGTSSYQCKFTIGGTGDPGGILPSSLMLLRARLLYNTFSQPFAVQAVGICGLACSLPPQERVIYAVGTVGVTQRKVLLEQSDKVVPPYLDYAIFSAGSIDK